MPFRLIIFLSAVLAVFLYLTLLNTNPVSIRLYEGVDINLPISLPLLVSFIAGVVTVLLLYFQDTLAETIAGIRRSARSKKSDRVWFLYESGKEQVLLENRKLAEKFFKKALALDQAHLPTLVALGALRREDGQLTEAIRLHCVARGIDGQRLDVLLELAEDYARSEQFANAIAVLNDAIKLAGKSAYPLTKARDIYLKAGNVGKAAELQKKIVAMVDRDKAVVETGLLAALLYEEASGLLSENKFYLARDGFKKVIRKNERFIPAYLKLAEVYERLGFPKDAVRTLEKAFKKTSSLVVLKAMEMFLMAHDGIDGVIDAYKWAMNAAPDEKTIGLFLAEVYLKNSDFESARRAMETLNGAVPDTTLYYLLKGAIHRGESNIDQALDCYNQACSRETDSFFRFTCSHCHRSCAEYSARCSSCGSWSSLEPDLSTR